MGKKFRVQLGIGGLNSKGMEDIIKSSSAAAISRFDSLAKRKEPLVESSSPTSVIKSSPTLYAMLEQPAAKRSKLFLYVLYVVRNTVFWNK